MLQHRKLLQYFICILHSITTLGNPGLLVLHNTRWRKLLGPPLKDTWGSHAWNYWIKALVALKMENVCEVSNSDFLRLNGRQYIHHAPYNHFDALIFLTRSIIFKVHVPVGSSPQVWTDIKSQSLKPLGDLSLCRSASKTVLVPVLEKQN